MTRQRMRNACFTAWTQTTYDKEYMKYIVVGEEVCPSTGKTHFQGYVEFVRALDFSLVKKLLGGEETHIERRKGSPDQASEYCKKDNKFFEEGTISKQGKRNDLDIVADDIQNGCSVKDIALNHPTQFIKYHRGIEKLRSYYIQPRSWITEITVLHGPTGLGKSRIAREMVKDYWVWTPARGKWFDGYEGHEEVIMEEFRGQLPMGFMLTLLDRYECPLEVKGGTVEFCPKKIVITSPKHPKDWYVDQPNDRVDQLLRRITTITELQPGNPRAKTPGDSLDVADDTDDTEVAG